MIVHHYLISLIAGLAILAPAVSSVTQKILTGPECDGSGLIDPDGHDHCSGNELVNDPIFGHSRSWGAREGFWFENCPTNCRFVVDTHLEFREESKERDQQNFQTKQQRCQVYSRRGWCHCWVISSSTPVLRECRMLGWVCLSVKHSTLSTNRWLHFALTLTQHVSPSLAKEFNFLD